MILSIFILVVLILINAFFALSEIAIVTLNDKKVKKLGAQGHVGAVKVLKLIGNSNDFLAMIQVGITLAGFLTSASASQSFAEPLAVSLSFTGLPIGILEGIATFLVTVILSYFSLVFGELIPKKIAMQNAEEVSYRVVGILLVFSNIFRPFIWFLSFSSNLVIRSFGIDPENNEQTVTEEEILMMVDAGQEKGLIEYKAKSMISGVFDFDNKTVAEIMTHRTEIIAVNVKDTVEDVVNLSIKNGISRIPVFEESIDKISGIIYVKDLLKFINAPIPKGLILNNISRPAMFVPNSKKCDELFAELTSSKMQISIVVDEYGGTEGLVTIEDLVESVFGNIQDEYDNEEEDIKKTGEDAFTVDGTTPIDEIEEATRIKIPEGDYDTIAGFLTEKFGRIPKGNEHPSVTLGDYQFMVLEVLGRRISKVRIFKNKL
ncbi:MAG: hemolysin family protein [Oscillospiraceae bacterium]|nr:hemolysin family protein [Oscillospiraceae bacterium]